MDRFLPVLFSCRLHCPGYLFYFPSLSSLLIIAKAPYLKFKAWFRQRFHPFLFFIIRLWLKGAFDAFCVLNLFGTLSEVSSILLFYLKRKSGKTLCIWIIILEFQPVEVYSIENEAYVYF